MEWYSAVLKKYAEFNGRARRKEYWMYTLINVVIILVLEIAGFAMMKNALGTIILGVMGLYCLATLLPSIAVAIRRLHDTGRSGWWLLVCVIPLVSLVLLVFMFLDSQPGANEYGPNPKGA
jgi:uncharacterized membrane protein YhaH (DUF805 family)